MHQRKEHQWETLMVVGIRVMHHNQHRHTQMELELCHKPKVLEGTARAATPCLACSANLLVIPREGRACWGSAFSTHASAARCLEC